MDSPHIVMLLSNGYRPDSRAQKEATSLIQAGFRVTILCWDRKKEFPPEEKLASGIRVVRVQDVPSSYGIGSGQLSKLPRFWIKAFHHLKVLKPDLIHCHDFDTLPAGLWCGKLRRIPVVYDAREHYAELTRPRLKGLSGNILFQLIRLAENWGARLADAIITVDEILGQAYRKLNRRVLIVGHYPERSMLGGKAPVFTRPHLTMFYAGRLSTDRGLMIYAGLLRQLLEMGVPARLVLAGAFTPVEEERKFRESVKGLEDRVDFRGWVQYDQMPGLMRSADLGLTVLMPEPRYVAALPMKLFEYMSAGLPVLASDFPLVREVVEACGCGILVDPLGDPAITACRIKEWWDQPEQARIAGEQGYQAVAEKFNWDKLAEKMIDLYRSLTHP